MDKEQPWINPSEDASYFSDLLLGSAGRPMSRDEIIKSTVEELNKVFFSINNDAQKSVGDES